MKPRILFAHGAGAGQGHPWMQAWRHRLGSVGQVIGFDYPYMTRGSKRPDPLKTLIAAHRNALEPLAGGSPLFLAGKSMGSRVGCHLANEPDVSVTGLICFGYPLVGVSKSKPVRDQVLLDLRTPILFVQGTRDRLCPLDRLEEVRRRMQTGTHRHVVEDGDHSLKLTKTFQKRTGITQEDADDAALEAVRRFVAARLAGR